MDRMAHTSVRAGSRDALTEIEGGGSLYIVEAARGEDRATDGDPGSRSSITTSSLIRRLFVRCK